MTFLTFPVKPIAHEAYARRRGVVWGFAIVFEHRHEVVGIECTTPVALWGRMSTAGGDGEFFTEDFVVFGPSHLCG